MRLLIVDDYPTMRRLLKDMLHEMGYTDVTAADDGLSALPILQAGGIDFLITDWSMPGMSGLALLKAVRADPVLAALPVLMVTAEFHRDSMAEAIQAGVSGYVVKPFTKQALQAAMARILTG